MSENCEIKDEQDEKNKVPKFFQYVTIGENISSDDLTEEEKLKKISELEKILLDGTLNMQSLAEILNRTIRKINSRIFKQTLK